MKKELQDKKRAHKRWIVFTLVPVWIIFIMLTSVTVYIDPFFHYHAPLSGWAYPLHNERYINDGIMRYFEYDGIITGSSMVENSKVSEAEVLFGGKFVKVPFAGGHYKEVNENLKRAYDRGAKIKCVIRCLDYSLLIEDKDTYRTDLVYPDYLYNDNWMDDIHYSINKETAYGILETVKATLSGGETTSFDDYENWSDSCIYGKAAVLSTYTLGGGAKTPRTLTEEEHAMVLGNIRQNVTDLTDEHPETTFYLFFTPYSICYWDVLKNNGEVDWRIDAEQVAIEELLKHPNIRLYSFCNNFDMVCNLDNYKDQAHYGKWVNSWMLEWMHDDEYLLTDGNYRDYLDTIREFYNFYDYGSLRR